MFRVGLDQNGVVWGPHCVCVGGGVILFQKPRIVAKSCKTAGGNINGNFTRGKGGMLGLYWFLADKIVQV